MIERAINTVFTTRCIRLELLICSSGVEYVEKLFLTKGQRSYSCSSQSSLQCPLKWQLGNKRRLRSRGAHFKAGHFIFHKATIRLRVEHEIKKKGVGINTPYLATSFKPRAFLCSSTFQPEPELWPSYVSRWLEEKRSFRHLMMEPLNNIMHLICSSSLLHW